MLMGFGVVVKMASPSVRSLSLLFWNLFVVLGSCRSFSWTASSNDEFPMLHLARRNVTDGNQTSPGNTESYACKFTQDYLLEAIKSNCSNYITPLEKSNALPPWERPESVASFANCTYHEIATRFADFPDGMLTLVFHGGSLFFTPSPNMSDARTYPPPPPMESSVWQQVTGQDDAESAPFLPILQDVTRPFFDLAQNWQASNCAAQTNGSNANTTNSTVARVPSPDSKMLAIATDILPRIEITAQQYTRCTLQTQPPNDESAVSSCVQSSLAKLHNPLPTQFFIYFGASSCDSKLWSFLGVALSIFLELLHLLALMYIARRQQTVGLLHPDEKQQFFYHSFSWLQFLIKLASGLGEPAVQAIMLYKANSLVSGSGSGVGGITGGSIGFVLAAMEFLQPTAAPLVAAISGWWFSKGFGFQVFATEAVTTLLGFAMILGFTSMQLLLGLLTAGGTTSTDFGGTPASVGGGDNGGTSVFIGIIGLLCAVAPWGLTYILFGLLGLPMQLGFFLGMVELFARSDTGYGFQLFFVCLGILVIVLGFIALTPIFAIWEAIWVGLKKNRKWQEKRRAKKMENGGVVMMEQPGQQQGLYPHPQYQHELHAQGSKEPLVVDGTKEVAMGGGGEEDLFPMARWFRRRFQNTKRWKRGFVKCMFWTFIVLSLVSFVGKWMFMVNILTFAGDVYCPSGYKEATFGGLGFKAGVLLIGVGLQFFGLTA